MTFVERLTLCRSDVVEVERVFSEAPRGVALYRWKATIAANDHQATALHVGRGWEDLVDLATSFDFYVILTASPLWRRLSGCCWCCCCCRCCTTTTTTTVIVVFFFRMISAMKELLQRGAQLEAVSRLSIDATRGCVLDVAKNFRDPARWLAETRVADKGGLGRSSRGGAHVLGADHHAPARLRAHHHLLRRLTLHWRGCLLRTTTVVEIGMGSGVIGALEPEETSISSSSHVIGLTWASGGRGRCWWGCSRCHRSWGWRIFRSQVRRCSVEKSLPLLYSSSERRPAAATARFFHFSGQPQVGGQLAAAGCSGETEPRRPSGSSCCRGSGRRCGGGCTSCGDCCCCPVCMDLEKKGTYWRLPHESWW